MPDWKTIVRDGIGGLRGVSCAEREEIVSEIAGHLEEAFEYYRAEGMSEQAAMERVLPRPREWNAAARRIRRTKRSPERMNDRTKQLWIPSLLTLALANMLLMALGEASLQPRAITSDPISWYPGITLALAYFRWIVAQPLTGAIGAYLSYRAGGNRRARLVACLFPSIVMFGLWCGLVPASDVVAANSFVMRHPTSFALGALGWVVVPGAALMFGALPFLVLPCAKPFGEAANSAS